MQEDGILQTFQVAKWAAGYLARARAGAVVGGVASLVMAAPPAAAGLLPPFDLAATYGPVNPGCIKDNPFCKPFALAGYDATTTSYPVPDTAAPAQQPVFADATAVVASFPLPVCLRYSADCFAYLDGSLDIEDMQYLTKGEIIPSDFALIDRRAGIYGEWL